MANPELTFVSFEQGKGFDIALEDTQISVGLAKGSDLVAPINEILAGLDQAARAIRSCRTLLAVSRWRSNPIPPCGERAPSWRCSPIVVSGGITMQIPTDFFGWVGLLLKQYGPLFLQGNGMTLLISLTGTIVGFLLGLLVAILRTIPTSRRTSGPVRGLKHVLNTILSIYIEVFRGTPMIVQAMVIYYGAMMAKIIDRTTPIPVVAIFIVSINTGAYMAEIICGGIISVDNGQKEAAYAIGMTHWQSMIGALRCRRRCATSCPPLATSLS